MGSSIKSDLGSKRDILRRLNHSILKRMALQVEPAEEPGRIIITIKPAPGTTADIRKAAKLEGISIGEKVRRIVNQILKSRKVQSV